MSSGRKTRSQKQSSISVVDFCMTKYMMSDLGKYHYKNLQALAKECHIPANLKREDLIRAIEAYQKSDTITLNAVLAEIKINRQNQTVKLIRKKARAKMLHNKRKKKPPSRTLRKKREKNIDSAPSDEKDLMLYNHFLSHSGNDVYPDSTEGNSLDHADRVPYPMMYPGQQPQHFSKYSQRRTLRSVTGMDNCCNGFPPLNDFQSSFAKSISALTPYNAMPSKDLSRNFKEMDSSCVPYFGNTFFHPPFMQFPPFNGYSVNNFNNSYKYENYYQSQLQNAPYYESSSVLSNNIGYDQEQLRIYSAPQNTTYYSKNMNQTSAMDVVDCPSYLLPNVPELRTNGENYPNASASWSQSSVVPTDSVSNANSMLSKSNTLVNCSYQENGPYQSQTNHETVAVGGNRQNTEFDSGSDAETVSLSGDVVNFLDLHSIDKTRDTRNESFDLPDFTSLHSRPQYPLENAKYCDSKNPVASTIEACCPNTICYEGCNLDESPTCDGNPSVETQNKNLQLPSFSSLFVDSMMNGRPYTNFKLLSKSFAEISANNITNEQSSYAANNLVPINYSQSAESDHIDLTLSPDELVHGQSDMSNILRDRLMMDNHVSLNENSKITSSDFNTSIQSSLSTDDNEISCSDCMNQIVPFQAQEKGVDVPDEAQRVIPDSNSVTQNFNTSNASVSKAVYERDDGRLIYKSEKLHCSKIVCDATSDKNIKEDIIRELVQIYIPKEKCETFDSPLSMVKLTSSENDIMEENGHQPTSVTESSLQILSTADASIPFCYPCKYRSEGCRKISKVDHVQVHEKICVYQPVYCPSDMCSWQKSMNLLSKHVYESHKMELRYRSQFVYTIDMLASDTDRSFHTFYQVHQKTIYVIRLHINENKCIATVQFIPEIESTICKNKRAKGIIKLLSFSKKLQVKTWKGVIGPYFENESQHKEDNTVRVDINNSEFISLFVFII